MGSNYTVLQLVAILLVKDIARKLGRHVERGLSLRKEQSVISERKLQANRRNAKKSTGPKDTRRTRHNALIHGLLSKAAIILDGDAKEDPRELDALREALWEDLEPEGAMEEILVEDIVACVWRKRRAMQAEVGKIRRGVDSAVTGVTHSTADQDQYTGGTLTIDARICEHEKHSGEFGRVHDLSLMTTDEIAHFKAVVDLARALVEEHGSLTGDQMAEVIKCFGDPEGSEAATLAAFSSMATDGLQVNDDEKPDTGRDSRSREKCKEALLAWFDRETAKLDKEIERLKSEAELVADTERLEQDAAVLSRHLPGDAVLEENLRYETAMDRQMYRALKELRELQAARRARSTRLGAADNGV